MKVYQEIENNYKKTAERMKENSYNIDNASKKTIYINKDIKFAEDTRINLHLFDNPLMSECVEELKYHSKTHNYDSLSLKQRYYYKPHIVSYDNYGTSSYWYIILSVNGYLTIYDFFDFDKLIIPNDDKIKDIIKRYENAKYTSTISIFN